MALFLAVAIEFTKKHFVDSPKETFDPATALGLAWSRKDKPNLEIDGYLFNVLRGEIRSIIGIKNFWDAAYLPMWMPFSPYSLSKSESRSRR